MLNSHTDNSCSSHRVHAGIHSYGRRQPRTATVTHTRLPEVRKILRGSLIAWMGRGGGGFSRYVYDIRGLPHSIICAENFLNFPKAVPPSLGQNAYVRSDYGCTCTAGFWRTLRNCSLWSMMLHHRSTIEE